MHQITLLESIFTEAVGFIVKNEPVICCGKGDSLSKAVQLMTERNIGCVVVVDSNRPIGIFTERDLLKKVVPFKPNLDTEPVSKYMTPSPVCIDASTEILAAMKKMMTGKFRHLVLTDEEGMLTNVVSIRNFLEYLVKAITESTKRP